MDMLFFGLGAYTTAILNVFYKIPILAAIPLAIVVPVFFGLLLAGLSFIYGATTYWLVL